MAASDADIVREALHTLYAYTSDDANPPGEGRSWSHEQGRAALDRLVAERDALIHELGATTAERDECRKAFGVGHSTLMRMQARAEAAEASLDKAVRDLRDQMEARDRLETELADAHELAIAPVSLHDALARAEAAEAERDRLLTATEPTRAGVQRRDGGAMMAFAGPSNHMCKCFGEGDGRDGSWRPCPPDLCEADVLVEAAAAREERLAELEAERDRLREALRQCRELFVDLRSDWSDNRGPCREGFAIIDAALEGETT